MVSGTNRVCINFLYNKKHTHKDVDVFYLIAIMNLHCFSSAFVSF